MQKGLGMEVNDEPNEEEIHVGQIPDNRFKKAMNDDGRHNLKHLIKLYPSIKL